MADLPRPHLLAYALVVLAVLAVAFRQFGGGGDTRGTAAESAPIRVDHGGSPGKRSSARLVVHVAGAVHRPGVYRLREGARVDDAVRRAGGPKPRADLSQLNLAAKLEDGRQVLVPVRMRVGGGGAVAGTQPSGPINLNTATAEQLDTLDGVGPVTVQKILDYRTEHGGFSNVDELGEIPGIGEVRLAALREQVTV